MTEDDLTELDGVGPARSDYLEEAGYDSFEVLAEADPEQLSEDVDVTDDKALSFVVQSQNIVAEEGAEVEESEPITQEIEEAVEETEEEEVEEEAEPEEEVEEEAEPEEEVEEEAEPEEEDTGPEKYTFEVEFEADLEYDTFFDAVMSQRAKMLRSNRSGVDAFDHALEQMRNGGTDEPVELTMTASQLNDLHNSVRQTSVAYKGDNLIDHMDALKQVLNQINEVREEHLF